MMFKNKIKYFIGCSVPVFACNFRCTYCYLSIKSDAYSGKISKFGRDANFISQYFSPKKIGGYCYFNFCGVGETLLHPEIIDLVLALTKEGHYCDIITNGTLSNKFDEIINRSDTSQREHLMIKFSFHYVQLKQKELLDTYVNNINKIKKSGISYSIEITPHDELIPMIPEIKEFSLKNFGFLPHITVARNEATQNIELLTKLSKEEYKKTWSVFDSKMFDFKFSIFGVKRCEYCYAGLWSFQVDLETGRAVQCYGGSYVGNIYKNNHLSLKAIGKCPQPHCFNGHAYLTYGTIPDINAPSYLEMRDRVDSEGNHSIQTEKMREFFSSKLYESNTYNSKRDSSINRAIYKDIQKIRLKKDQLEDKITKK